MLPSKKKIISFMKEYYPDFIDNKTNEINMTELAEYAADYFCEVGGYNVFLDEVTFDIDELFFECASEISELYNLRQLLMPIQ